MTELPKQPKPASNLYERIRARVDPLGGVDLELSPREPGREPPCFDVDEATVTATDHMKAQEQWGSLLNRVESGAEFIITRGDMAVARSIPVHSSAALKNGEGAS